MKIRVYLSMSRNNVEAIARSFEVGKDNVISIGYGAIQEDDENIPKLFYNKGYYHSTVKSVSDTKEYKLVVLD